MILTRLQQKFQGLSTDSSDEDIAQFVGESKFMRSGSSRYVTYAINGVGVITKLKPNCIIVHDGQGVIEISHKHLCDAKYEIE